MTLIVARLLWTVCAIGLSATYAHPAPQSPDNIEVSTICVPPSLDAPYGLPVTQYEGVYTTTRTIHQRLRQAGCEIEVLGTLLDCNPPTSHVLVDTLSKASGTCEVVISGVVRDARKALIQYGCLPISPDAPMASATTADLVSFMSSAAVQTSARTVCSAIMKSVRRSFEDAQLGIDPATALAILPVGAPLAPVTINPTDGQNSGVVPSVDTTPGLPHLDSPELITERPEVTNVPDVSSPPPRTDGPSLWAALFAGALAGLAVDLSLFPLDTIKTRLQSSSGFRAAGGFKGLYQGIGSIALGSAPSSALFFLAYEFAGKRLTQNIGETFLGHLLATTVGELTSSLIRVPADVVKSRQQVELPDGVVRSASLWTAIYKVYEEGNRPNSRSRLSAFYTGWLSSIVREIPFGCIQFPLFSYLKSLANAGHGGQLSMTATALCGMVAGSFAGSLTTPLDVVKTRIMLGEKGESGIVAVLMGIIRDDGLAGLFKGVVPRTLWISAGGAIFLGGYDGFARLIDSFRYA